jgi:multiple antibiotic resistance protein
VWISTVDYIVFLSDLVKATVALFIIVDPLGNIPIFMSLTEKIDSVQRKKVFNVAVLVGFVLLLVFAFLGQEILNLFGLSIYSFEVAGGILLLIISIRILVTGSKESNTEPPESIGAVPIAMPLLVGPGAITTTMFTLQQYSTDGYLVGVVIAVLAVVIVLSITWVILRFMNGVYKILGKTGSLVISRVMALLIAALAIQYILSGLNNYLALNAH